MVAGLRVERRLVAYEATVLPCIQIQSAEAGVDFGASLLNEPAVLPCKKLTGFVSICLFTCAAIALIPHIVGGYGTRTRTTVSKGHVSKYSKAILIRLVSVSKSLAGSRIGIEPTTLRLNV